MTYENPVKLSDRDVLLKILCLISEAKTLVDMEHASCEDVDDIEWRISDIRRYALVEIERAIRHDSGI